MRRRLLWRWAGIGVGAVVAVAAVAAAVVLAATHRALWPAPVTVEERLAMLPTEGLPLSAPVEIRWNRHLVPFLDAASDDDLAFALGMVHAHLRWGQLEVLRRVAQGRLAEMAGPAAVPVDEALRILDLDRAAPAIVAAMDDDTLRWTTRFVDGLNEYVRRAPRHPPELALLGIRPSPFTVEDVVAISRLAGADVNWLAAFVLLGERTGDGFERVWTRALAVGASSTASFEPGSAAAGLAGLLRGASRSGSNAVAVAPRRSATGAALLAGDPHLGTALPNFWLLAGIRSPGLEAVGMMVPGLPFVAVGRSPHLAWGGTNMRSASSDLYDVTALDPTSFGIERETIRVRFGRDREVVRRWSPLGPVVSDALAVRARDGEALALRWVGHDASDDIGAFLRAGRARTLEELVAAFEGYAVSGQNILVATADGRIAHLLAVRLPERGPRAFERLVLDPDDPGHRWNGFLDATELPVAVDPPEGFLASANNRPVEHDPPIGVLFGQPERIGRLHELLEGDAVLSLDDLAAVQRDVVSPAARRLAGAWVAAVAGAGLGGAAPGVVALLDGWDGGYRADDPAPVAFECLTARIVERLYDSPFARSWNHVATFAAGDLAGLAPSDRRTLLTDALAEAAADAARFATWGDMHTSEVRHLLGAVPALGRFFTYDVLPAAGSRETILKTDHPITAEASGTSYGSQARHLSSMDDPDHNWFVLRGGNDGWLGSAAFLDQMPLWRRGELLRMPLRPEVVEKELPLRTELRP